MNESRIAEIDDKGFKVIDTKTFHTIEMDLDDNMIEPLLEYARSLIVNDKDELLSYAITKILTKMVERDDLAKEIVN